MNNISIISTHTTLTSAIDAAGGLNRDYNPTAFDLEVKRTEKDASEQTFHVIEQYGRKTVIYYYQCDIRLLNAFSPFGATLSGSTELCLMLKDEITIIQNVKNCSSNRKKIAKAQLTNPALFVANF
jgi:hypothetical protein